jgi:acetyl-CoA carboxylase carboxyl transferase subunit alpha
MAQEAAQNLKLTATDLKGFNIVDSVIREPEGFSRFDMDASVEDIRRVIRAALRRLTRVPPDRLVENRHQKFLNMRGL